MVGVGNTDGIFASLKVFLRIDVVYRGGYGHIAVRTTDGDVIVFGAAANFESKGAVALTVAFYGGDFSLLGDNQCFGFVNGLGLGYGGAVVAVFYGNNVVAGTQRRDVIAAIGREGSLKRAAQTA